MDGTDWRIDHPQSDPALAEIQRLRRVLAAADRLAEAVKDVVDLADSNDMHMAVSAWDELTSALAAYLAERRR